jgi:hypothetical protein
MLPQWQAPEGSQKLAIMLCCNCPSFQAQLWGSQHVRSGHSPQCDKGTSSGEGQRRESLHGSCGKRRSELSAHLWKDASFWCKKRENWGGGRRLHDATLWPGWLLSQVWF